MNEDKINELIGETYHHLQCLEFALALDEVDIDDSKEIIQEGMTSMVQIFECLLKAEDADICRTGMN